MITASGPDSRCGHSAIVAEKEKHHCTNARNSIIHQSNDSTYSFTTVCKDPNMLGRGGHTVENTAVAPLVIKGTKESGGKCGCEKRPYMVSLLY